MSDRRRVSDVRLRVDFVACDGHALCAQLLPEVITLDEWGYPILANGRTSDPLPHSLLRLAQAAIDACPTLALQRDRQDSPRHPPPAAGV
ncbi:hypothetical protein Psed_0742 [Pseudonocardia dioxanivorans CB1190]|jgi:ferredoxin|uniref:Ferredoxin n=1 Tax=Pseudonocardia dioxanivorans (strain ATCC 55486 / DSM 44775 / JCM 13855 / CB1190) TaxID=675635 RepID=F4CM90_PSEUX|nr:hypothetical protein Psed_0742 [Pseudonocardia dioxanivorans CB1190]GJF01555.1 hypothetical protein PSD17_05190 [Pseudonocardia sp. D17]